MDLAVLGTRLVTAIADGTRVRVDVEGDPVPQFTGALPAALMPPAIAVAPDGRIAVAGRTDTGQIYGCLLGRPWVYLGPANTRQGVAWKDGRFVWARVVWSQGRLYEQTIEYDEDGTGREVDLASQPCDSAGGVHYFDTIDGRWLPVAPRETQVWPFRMLRPVRRPLNGGIVYCGQVVGTPDYQAIASTDGTIAFRAAAQIEMPTFVAVGDRLVCVDRANVVRSFRPPYPVETPAPSIPKIGRAMYAGFFEFVPASLPGNCELRQVSTWEWGVWSGGKQIAVYVSGHPADGSIADLEKSIAAVKDKGLPIWAYWPKALQAGRLPRGCDVTAVECYRRVNESLTDYEAGITAAVRRCGKVALIGQGHTSNKLLTADIASIPPVLARVAKAQENVIAVVGFSGSGRPTGLQEHPAVLALWGEMFAGIPPLPSEDDVNKPGVEVIDWEPVGPDKTGRIVKFRDRNNPQFGTVTVELDEGYVRAAIENAAGSDRSSRRDRKVI